MLPYSGRDCYHNYDGIDKHWLKDMQQIINNIVDASAALIAMDKVDKII